MIMCDSVLKQVEAIKEMVAAGDSQAPAAVPTPHKTFTLNEGGGAYLSDEEERMVANLLEPDANEVNNAIVQAMATGRMSESEASAAAIRSILDRGSR